MVTKVFCDEEEVELDELHVELGQGARFGNNVSAKNPLQWSSVFGPKVLTIFPRYDVFHFW